MGFDFFSVSYKEDCGGGVDKGSPFLSPSILMASASLAIKFRRSENNKAAALTFSLRFFSLGLGLLKPKKQGAAE